MTIEILDIECPEGYGETTLTIFLKEHESSRGKIDEIDRVAIDKIDCELQDELLSKNNNCNSSCRNSQEIKRLLI